MSRIATMKKRMNQGTLIFLASPLKMSAVTSDSGTIQSARVSFIVVAISSASGLDAELLVVHSKPVAENWENEEGNGVENEYRA